MGWFHKKRSSNTAGKPISSAIDKAAKKSVNNLVDSLDAEIDQLDIGPETRPGRIVFKQDRRTKRWQWLLMSNNGTVTASSVTYGKKFSCVKAARQLQDRVAKSEILEETVVK